MFERFTDRARKVMALASREAQRFNHEYIGTEHILLGLVKEGSGVGATALKTLNVDIKMLRVEVEKLVRSGPDVVTYGKLPQTPRAKRVIEFAIEEARALNHRYVGTEHILLGLLRESEGIAAQVLTNLGLKLEDARQEVLNLVGAGVQDTPNDLGLKISTSVGRKSPALDSSDRDLTQLAVGERAAPTRPIGLPSFTSHAKRVMALAHREAVGCNHRCIETEHVLLALIKVGDKVVQEILKRLNVHVDTETLQQKIETLPHRERDRTVEGDLPQASHTRNALRYAIREAVALHRRYVGTEHLLMALMSESETRAGQILKECGLTSVDAVRQEAVRLRAEVSDDEADSLLRQTFPAGLLTHLGLPPRAVTREADKLAIQVYEATGAFPKVKARDIVSQMRRCALSVPPHLAEANRRAGRAESRWFLSIAISALIELQYLLEFSLKQAYVNEEQYSALRELSDRVEKQLRDFPKPMP